MQSLAWRIHLVFTGLVCLTVSACALLSFLAYAHIQQLMLDELAQAESQRLVQRVSHVGGRWETPLERNMGPSMFAWGETPDLQAGTMPAEFRDLPVGLHRIDKPDGIWHVAVAPALDGRLYVLYDSVLVNKHLEEFSRVLIAIVMACTLFAIFVSHYLGQWLTRPLHRLTERLTKWVPASTSALRAHGNEADHLMEVFNRVQNKLDASIADQREFSANLHHEIRTSLATIQSDAELMLKLHPEAPSGLRMRLERIAGSVVAINQSLESTYSLAQSQFMDTAQVNLHACVTEICESLRAKSTAAELKVVNLTREDHEATVSYYALMIVLRNIMRNAIHHAAPATLTVRSISEGLEFIDDGPGIAAAELPNLFERYFSNRRADQQPASACGINQSGLGLAIAKRVCLMQSWHLDAASPVADDHGTCFTLRFTAGAAG